MNLGKLAPLALGGVILTAGLASASVAQQPPLPATAMPGKADRDGRHGDMRHADPAKRAERLRAALQLRPDQETALKAFLDSHQRPAGARENPHEGRGETAGLTTPQRLDAEKARMAEHQARFEQNAAATKRFYAQLSPAQQKAFDALHAGRGGHGGGRHGRMGGHG